MVEMVGTGRVEVMKRLPLFLCFETLLRAVEAGTLKAGEIWQGLFFLDRPRQMVFERLRDKDDYAVSAVTRTYVLLALSSAEQSGRVKWFESRQDVLEGWYAQFTAEAHRWIDSFDLISLPLGCIRTYADFKRMCERTPYVEAIG